MFALLLLLPGIHAFSDETCDPLRTVWRNCYVPDCSAMVFMAKGEHRYAVKCEHGDEHHPLIAINGTTVDLSSGGEFVFSNPVDQCVQWTLMQPIKQMIVLTDYNALLGVHAAYANDRHPHWSDGTHDASLLYGASLLFIAGGCVVWCGGCCRGARVRRLS